MSIFCRMNYTVNDNDRTGVAACVILIGFFQYTVVELENFVSLALKAYGKGGHWVMMAFKDSKLWCEEQCQALLQGAHFRAQFDWCAFGGNTKRSSIIVASSPAFKRMRWTCTQQEFVHQHSGYHYQLHSYTSLSSCMHCVDGALGPPVFFTAERLPRPFPCHVLSDVCRTVTRRSSGKICRVQDST